MPNPNLCTQLEAILFVAPAPMTTAQLATLLGVPEDEVESGMETLSQRLTGGIRLSNLASEYRLVTAPELAPLMRKVISSSARSELSRPALETLAIIAYRGPITKTGIEEIRGVASDTMIRNLLARDLIHEAGHSSEPGRPVRYSVSHAFLQHFGLTSPTDLPPLPEPTHEA